MGGKVFISMVFISAMTYFTLFFSSFFIFWSVNTRIDNINECFIKTIVVNNQFSHADYMEFKEELSFYGQYNIEIKLESRLSNGMPDIFYAISDIQDKTLEKGDILQILIYDTNPSLIEKVSGLNYRPMSVKTFIIT